MPTTKDLVALHDEIAGLRRVGISLGPELRRVGTSERPEMKRLGDQIAQSNDIASIAAALASGTIQLPSKYHAVLEAGLRSGRLTVLVEGICEQMGRQAALYRGLTAALAYPLFIAALAYALLVSSLIYYLPTLVESYRDLEIPPSVSLSLCIWLRSYLPFWAPLPVLLLVLAFATLKWQQAKAVLGWNGLLTPVGLLPGFRRSLVDSRHASVARLTALLLEHHVPLADSLRLAASVAGNRSMRRAVASGTSQALRPMLRWAIAHARGEEETNACSQPFVFAAEMYEAHAATRMQWLRRILPIVTLAVLGGGLTLLYFFTVLAPFLQLIMGLA